MIHLDLLYMRSEILRQSLSKQYPSTTSGRKIENFPVTYVITFEGKLEKYNQIK